MNNFEIIIEEFSNQYKANQGVNETIQEFTDNNQQVLDITSHIKTDDDGTTYVFIYKVQSAEK